MNVALLAAAAIVASSSAAWYHVRRPNKDRALSLKLGVIDVRSTVASAAANAVLYSIVFLLVMDMLKRDRVPVLPLADGTIVYLMFLTALCAATGHGMRCASKNVAYHLKNLKRHDAYLVNRVFHIPFSHHLLYFSMTAFACLAMVLEIDHPDGPMGRAAACLTVALGMFLGGAAGYAVRAGFVIPKIGPRHVICQAFGLGAATAFFTLLFAVERVDLFRLPVTTCLYSAACIAFGLVARDATRLVTSRERRGGADG